MIKKEDICPYCNKPITQGHDQEKCKNREFKTYKIIDRKMYIPTSIAPKGNVAYELIPISENTFMATLSGNQRLGTAVSGVAYTNELNKIRPILKEDPNQPIQVSSESKQEPQDR